MSQPVDSAVSAVRTSIGQHRAAFLDDLAEWLRIPSVPVHPDHAADVRRSSDRLAAELQETGFPTAEVRQTPGVPVFAEWPPPIPRCPRSSSTAATACSPPPREDGWGDEPFEPVIRENRLHARGGRRQGPGVLPHARRPRPPRHLRAYTVLALLHRLEPLRQPVQLPSVGRPARNGKAELDLLLQGVETTAYLSADLDDHRLHAP
jgi:hypothetical protein